MKTLKTLRGICSPCIQASNKPIPLVVSLSLLLSMAACATGNTGNRGEFNIGGSKVAYVMQSCKPSVKWDGMTLVLDGLNVPGGGSMKFSMGKIDYSDKAIREIKDTVFYYDGMLTSTCQTLVRLSSEEAVERYSMHRDKLLQDMATTLTQLEKAGSDSTAISIAQAGKERASEIGAAPKKP